jgi:adenine-specific DNA-methyltransferase
MTNKRRLPGSLKVRARTLRRDATKAESLMWQIVRNRGVANAKFRRQHPVGGFVLDFYCDEAKLGIELDGARHRDAATVERAAERSRMLMDQHGVRVIRLWNGDLLQDKEKVIQVLHQALQERQSGA